MKTISFKCISSKITATGVHYGLILRQRITCQRFMLYIVTASGYLELGLVTPATYYRLKDEFSDMLFSTLD